MTEYKSGSNLEKVLKAGYFAFTGECGPPRGANVEVVKKKAQYLKGCVDAVNITDNQTAVVRMSSWAASLILLQEGLDPNFQMVCRDRNRLAMQSDILGVSAHGIKNMLCLSGDHQRFGDHPDAKNVYDKCIQMQKKIAFIFRKSTQDEYAKKHFQFLHPLDGNKLQYRMPDALEKVFSTNPPLPSAFNDIK